MATPCYVNQLKGKEPPVTDEERFVIWKWAKENAIDPNPNPQLHDVQQMVNDKFFGGQAPKSWINDILSGRKTPFKALADDMWKKQYNRRLIAGQAEEVTALSGQRTFKEIAGKILKEPSGKDFTELARKVWNAPRALVVTGHSFVFPISHAGDLIFTPTRWKPFWEGWKNTYKAAFSEAETARMVDQQEGEGPMFDLALRSGVDTGPKSHPVGLISRVLPGEEAGGGRIKQVWNRMTNIFGPQGADRAWKALSIMRYELWKGEVNKWIAKNPELAKDPAQLLDVGQQFARWANHATGSAALPHELGGGWFLFGPKLTYSKLQRVIADPVRTMKTFANWKDASSGERAVAWTRLSGATQYLGTMAGLLAVNQAFLSVLGSKDKVNMSDPTKGDFLSFKGNDLLANVPGLHSEIRTLGKVLAAAFLSKKQLHGETRFGQTAKILGQYGMGKLHPTLERGLEIGFRQDWLGRPLPWSTELGTPSRPKLTYVQYAASIGPIPLEGPIGYVYDTLKEGGMSAVDASALTKALIIGGMGAPGFHIREDYTKKYGKGPQRSTKQPFAQ